VQLYAPEADEDGTAWYAGPSTLRSIRGGRMLVGQDNKEMRDRRNMFSSHGFLRALLVRLNYPGLAPRATNLFNLAMKAGSYRWGNKAVLVAGASVAIALRESGKGETLEYLASLISVSPVSLSRIFLQIKSHLSLSLPPTDVILFFPPLLNYIKSLLADTTSDIPPNLRNYFSEISLSSVLSLATSLAAITGNVGLAEHRHIPPVACALLLVAFEGHTAKAMPSLDVMATRLANQANVNAAKSTVLERYREIGRLVGDYKKRLPWFEQQRKTQSSKASTSTSGKQGKLPTVDRADNARWVKDVITFQEELWKTEHAKTKAKMESGTEKKGDTIDLVFEYGYWEEEEETTSTLSGLMSPESSTSGQSTKRRRTEGTESAEVQPCRPAAYVYPDRGRNIRYNRDVQAASTSLLALESVADKVYAPIPETTPEQPQSFRAYLLSASVFPAMAPPSRLALLAAAKGEGSIRDEELFEEGELEGFLRGETEVEEIWRRKGQEWSAKRRRGSESDDRLLGRVDEDTGPPRFSLDDVREPRLDAASDTVNEEVVGEWRELSPGLNPNDDLGFGLFDDADW